MPRYLILQDYHRQIPAQHLTDLVGDDLNRLLPIETAAVQEITSYLVQKYDTAAEFTDTPLHVKANTYKAKNRVYIDATAYSAATTYGVGDLALYQGRVYRCLQAATTGAWNPTKWSDLGPQYSLYHALTPKPDWSFYTNYVEGNQVFYKDKTYTAAIANSGLAPDENPAAWGSGSAYSVPSGTGIWDTNYWTAGDNRSQQMVMAVVDAVLFHLHSRIAPSNVPEFRVARYEHTIQWLKDCAKGDNITADLPRIQPRAGQRIRYGAAMPKQQNNW